ncbi:hypothetical protein GDO86_013817 [Hymenochirus boettgeri]|uniref:sphingosine kinase n=1 Tax=Hymenochirus boettgeri TaxID=247094 RepID=A0A8T2JRR7_9PIPI|nr:hypothetical protein GDO86_013817 [Hymenochirus boettgeri]
MGENQAAPRDPGEFILSATFTLVPDDGSLLSLILTRRELLIQNLRLDPQTNVMCSHLLADCVGCHSFRGKDSKDLGGYFTAVFYPLKNGMTGRDYRQRESWTFRTEFSQDQDENYNLVRSWTEKISQMVEDQGHPISPPRSPRRFLVLLNPFAGTGKALSQFETHVMPMLEEMKVRYTLLVTERRNQAYELVRDEDLSGWDVIVVMSGDGLMYEVINGLMERQDRNVSIKKPLAILPGGSGNALAASLNHYSGQTQVTGTKLLNNCTFILCKGRPSPLDLVSLTTSSNRRILSFLSFSWGLISDVDVESEKYRFMGSVRFSIGTFVRLTMLRSYGGCLSYLPARSSSVQQKGTVDAHLLSAPHNSTNNVQNSHTDKGEAQILEDSLLVPLDQPVPSHWTTVPENQFILILLLYQSHLGADLYAAPMVSGLGEGVIQLFYATSSISRKSLLKLFLAMEKGTHLEEPIPHFNHVPVTAFRIEPLEATGIMTVDGESIPCCSVQGQIHRGLGRIINIPNESQPSRVDTSK